MPRTRETWRKGAAEDEEERARLRSWRTSFLLDCFRAERKSSKDE